MSARAHFPTEAPNPASEGLDRLSVADAFDVMNAEDATVAAAVARAKAATSVESIARSCMLRDRAAFIVSRAASSDARSTCSRFVPM